VEEMLDDKKHETLLILQEECSEVIQAISKIFRFGLDNFKPGKPNTNQEHLENEIGDLLALVILLHEQGVLRDDVIEKAIQAKFEKLKLYSRIYESKTN
jgi:NTP pyrophosphatase (non-canonical NTP hydrolase)